MSLELVDKLCEFASGEAGELIELLDTQKRLNADLVCLVRDYRAAYAQAVGNHSETDTVTTLNLRFHELERRLEEMYCLRAQPEYTDPAKRLVVYIRLIGAFVHQEG